jgi:TfoX/Sxy family transcriptional regulator of competence genes
MTADLKKWNIQALHPQEYLTVLYEMSPEVVVSKLYDMSGKLKRDPKETLSRLHKSIQLFADVVAADLGWALL